jgi:hypothetical protein
MIVDQYKLTLTVLSRVELAEFIEWVTVYDADPRTAFDAFLKSRS